MKKLDQQGFTILEVLISSVVMSIAILGASLQYVSQLQSEAGLRMQMQNRQVLNQVMTTLSNSPSLFPHLADSGELPVIYVACFNSQGSLIANTIPGSGTVGFTAVFAGLTGGGIAQRLSATNGGMVACTSPTGGFEVHISWASTGQYAGAVLINSIVIPNQAKAYAVAAPSINSIVYP